MTLPLFVFNLRFELVHYLLVLLDIAVLLLNKLVDLLLQLVVVALEPFIFAFVGIGFICSSRHPFFHVLQFLLEVALSGLHLALVLVQMPLDVLFRLRLSLLHLSEELFFLERYPFTLEFDGFEFVSVLAGEFIILDLPVFVLGGLHLVFFIHSHYAFQVSLHPLKICGKLTILMGAFRVFSFQDIDLLFIVLLIFNHLTDRHIQILEFSGLPEFQLF